MDIRCPDFQLAFLDENNSRVRLLTANLTPIPIQFEEKFATEGARHRQTGDPDVSEQKEKTIFVFLMRNELKSTYMLK